ncbi:MAG TPA: TonB-dependent receptor [Pyrinomonadaceae bacterium]|nr:TonB-dependent receptor [Pyrinomonadaceae bacterium]
MRIPRIALENVESVLVCMLSLLLLLVLTMPGRAQTTTGTISGEVTDPNGAKVPGAKITATNVQTSIARSVTADEDGRFVISELAPGPYEVLVERQGFTKELHRGLVLTVGRDAVLNVGLKVGDIAQQVEITGDAPLVNTTTSEVSALVNERTIKELPLNGRDLLQLATLQIGVVNAGFLADPQQINSGTGTVKMSINGGRISFNNFMLDGTSVNEVQNTTPGSVAGGFTGVDAVQEFQLLTNNYSAEFGGAGGGIVNMITKSGGNQVHGTAFEFLRNSALDARNVFDTVDLDNDGKADVPPFKRNQFGGSIGAPIRKNQTFIFGAYEGLRQRLAQTNTFFVPTAAARNGIIDGVPIPGGVAPAIRPYLDFYPLPNGGDVGGGLGIFTRGDTGRIDEDYFLIRGDHNISSKDTFFARYLFDDSERDEPKTVNTDSLLKARNQYVGLGETHIFSPHLINNVRFAFNRSRVEGDEIDVVQIPESLFWVPGAIAIGLFRDLGGLSPLSDRTLVPRFLVNNNFEVSDQLGYVRGSHNMKFGFTFRRIQLNAVSANIPFGAFIFGSYENFLTASYFIFAASLPTANDVYRGIRTSLFAGYFQDDWRVRSNLTLNLGLRYEPMTSPTEANNKVSNLRDYLRDSASTVGLPFFKNNTKKNFGPRVGFAWDVFGNGKTSLRGGYGIFFAQIYPAGYRFEMSNQAPFDIIGFAFGPALGALLGIPPEFFPPFPNAFSSLGDIPGLVALEAYEFDPQPSYVQQWNLTGQRQLFGSLTATVAYVGSRGIHLPTNSNRNTSANFTLLPDGEKQFPPGGNPLRNPAFGPVRVTTHSGDSYYHALQVNLERRFAQGLQMQMAYTLSKSIDTSSDAVGAYFLESTQFAQDPYNLRADRGLSVFDVRHNFSLNTIYQLPYKTESSAHGARKVQDLFLGGWELNSIITARSGTPFNPIISFNNSNDGNTDNIQRPDWAPGATPESAVTGGVEHYFSASAFVPPPAGQFGNVGRNVLTGPGLFTVDLSFLKTNKIGERLTMQFRAEAFNLFNRANFALPDVVTVFTDQDGTIPPNVGRITRTSTTSRQLQFGVKFIF